MPLLLQEWQRANQEEHVCVEYSDVIKWPNK